MFHVDFVKGIVLATTESQEIEIRCLSWEKGGEEKQSSIRTLKRGNSNLPARRRFDVSILTGTGWMARLLVGKLQNPPNFHLAVSGPY